MRKKKVVLSHSPQRFPIASSQNLASAQVPLKLWQLSAYASAVFGLLLWQQQAWAQTAESSKPATPQVPLQTVTVQAAPIKNDSKTLPTTIEAEEVQGRPERYIQFDRNVKVDRGDSQVKSETGRYTYLDDSIEASGRVEIRRKGDCYWGNKLRLQLDSGAGYLTEPRYELQRNQARGSAEKVEFQDEERSQIQRGTYTTCQSPSPDWYLQADTLNLDTGLDTGVAGKSVVYFKGVPILVMPSLTFPLSGARHSGFLPPVLGASSKGGVDVTVPYYWNIAPNRDLTLYPRMISRRGLQLGVEGRYLGETTWGGLYSGETSLEYLPNDRVRGGNRYALASIHQQKLLPNLDLNWNVNMASDDDYPSDFSRSITKTSQRLLLREANLIYYGSFWNLGLRTTNYQVLQDPQAIIQRPYDRLPQLQFHAEQHDVAGLDWSVDAIVTRFWHPTLQRGDRIVFNPQLSLPIVSSGYFLIPKIAFHASNYHIVNPLPGEQYDFHRVVPTVSIDSGLVFERQVNLFDKDLTQTLEPRLFYVNTPFREQDKFPNFDSALADFNFAQIFSENRFTGHDRIGDANQVTAAVVSRFIESNGEEALRLAIGQRFYFNHQRVSLDNSSNPSRSDLLLAAQGKITSTLTGDMAVQLSQSDRRVIRSSYALSWQPAPKKVLNLAYRFQRDNLEQVDISGQWPVADRWYAVGRANYSTRDNKLVDGLAGFEYKADCWSLRFIAQRFAVNSSSSSTGFSLQLELNGLARLGVGNNPLEALKRNINGYQALNQP